MGGATTRCSDVRGGATTQCSDVRGGATTQCSDLMGGATIRCSDVRGGATTQTLSSPYKFSIAKCCTKVLTSTRSDIHTTVAKEGRAWPGQQAPPQLAKL